VSCKEELQENRSIWAQKVRSAIKVDHFIDSLSKTRTIPRFQTIYELGSGAFGRVEKVYDQQSSDVRAVRIMKTKGDAPDYTREVNLLQSLFNPNIVTFSESFKVESELYILMELCGKGNLSYHKQRMTEMFPIAIIRDVAAALAEIHGKNLVHFDVKPQNILLSSINETKLSDFGVSRRADSTIARTGCAKPGTRMYRVLHSGLATRFLIDIGKKKMSQLEFMVSNHHCS
jgi:serine/threonine protein kinase